jgi:MFS family permease
LAVYLVAILNAGSFFGRIVSPIPMIFSPFIPNSFYTLTYAADRVGPLNMLLVCFVGSAILAFGWIGVHSTAGTIIFCLLYGAFSGALISLVLTVIAAKLCPDLTSLGVRIGMVCVFCSIGILVGSPLGGILLRDGWVSLQSFAGAMLTAGAVGILIIRYLTVGFSFRVKT